MDLGWPFACRYVRGVERVVCFEGKEKKVQSQQSPGIEPRARGLSCLCSDHWAPTSPYNPAQEVLNAPVSQNVLSELHRGWPENSEEKTHAECSLISLTLHIVEHLASAGKWREVVREMPGGRSSVFRTLAAQARGTGFYVAAFQLCRTDFALAIHAAGFWLSVAFLFLTGWIWLIFLVQLV